LIDGQLDPDSVRTAGEGELRNGLGLDGWDNPNHKAGAEQKHKGEEGAVHSKRNDDCAIKILRAFCWRSHGDLAKDGDGPLNRLSHRSAYDCPVTSGMP
jgi:hypothetical protein